MRARSGSVAGERSLSWKPGLTEPAGVASPGPGEVRSRASAHSLRPYRAGVATVTQKFSRSELVSRLVRAGELEVSGEDQAEVDTYFDRENFRFHGPDGFESGYAGLTAYFASIRAAFDDRKITRGIIVAEGSTMACQTWIEGTFARVHPVASRVASPDGHEGRMGPDQHLPVR